MRVKLYSFPTRISILLSGTTPILVPSVSLNNRIMGNAIFDHAMCTLQLELYYWIPLSALSIYVFAVNIP